jgi:hypothetical protein
VTHSSMTKGGVRKGGVSKAMTKPGSRWLACVVLAGSAATLHAQSGPPPTVASLTRAAGRVVVARVADVQSRFGTNQFGDQLILSDLVLDVTETLKGSDASTMRVTVEGGTVGGLTLRVSDLPSFDPGDRAVFFLDAVSDGSFRPHDRGHGLLKLSRTDAVEGRPLGLTEVRRQVNAALGSTR